MKVLLIFLISFRVAFAFQHYFFPRTDDGFQSRFGGGPVRSFFKHFNPLSFGKFGSFHKDEYKPSTTEACPHPGAKIVHGKCYEFFKTGKTFKKATKHCKNKGAQMWVPDLQNPFLLQTYFKDFPEIFEAAKGVIWVGFKGLKNKIVDIHDQDMSNFPLMLIGKKQISHKKCVYFDFQHGILHPHGAECDNEAKKKAFVCEYPKRVTPSYSQY